MCVTAISAQVLCAAQLRLQVVSKIKGAGCASGMRAQLAPNVTLLLVRNVSFLFLCFGCEVIFEFRGERRNDLVEVADDAVVGNVEDRS